MSSKLADKYKIRWCIKFLKGVHLSCRFKILIAGICQRSCYYDAGSHDQSTDFYTHQPQER